MNFDLTFDPTRVCTQATITRMRDTCARYTCEIHIFGIFSTSLNATIKQYSQQSKQKNRQIIDTCEIHVFRNFISNLFHFVTRSNKTILPTVKTEKQTNNRHMRDTCARYMCEIHVFRNALLFICVCTERSGSQNIQRSMISMFVVKSGGKKKRS